MGLRMTKGEVCDPNKNCKHNLKFGPKNALNPYSEQMFRPNPLIPKPIHPPPNFRPHPKMKPKCVSKKCFRVENPLATEDLQN